MNYILKHLFVLYFTFTCINASEIFVDTEKLNLSHITLSYQYCKNTQTNSTLCKSKELSYIDYDDHDLPKFLKGLKFHLSPLLIEYKNNDLKNSTLADLNDFSGDLTGEWSDKKSITLFAKTSSTYTLSTTSNGYSGGAHGYYTIAFKNISIETQKEVKLCDLFKKDFNTTLHNIAQDIYKKTYGLKAKQSLLDDGWFENKFVLAENFAITSKGLLFYYNSYEIKPYSAGHTRFMLPYDKIKSIIKPEGILSFVFEKSNDFAASFHEKDVVTVTLSDIDSGVTAQQCFENHSVSIGL